MRISLTVVDPLTRNAADVLLDADPYTPVGELAPQLAAAVRWGETAGAAVVSLAARQAPGAVSGGSADAGGLGIPSQDAAVRLYVAGLPLDPAGSLADSPLR